MVGVCSGVFTPFFIFFSTSSKTLKKFNIIFFIKISSWVRFMEQLERWIYGLTLFLGGVFLLSFMGVRLLDLLSKTVFYFMLIFFIILMLYGVFLILVGILLMSVNLRAKKSTAFIIFLVGIIIIILSISVIIIDSFTSVNVVEILSGVGLIILGFRLYFPKVKIKAEEKKVKTRRSLGLVSFIIGLIISGYYGLIFVMIMVSYNLESVFYQLPLVLPPFLLGIFLIIYGIYSRKIPRAVQESKNVAVLPMLRAVILLLLFLSILFTFLFVRIELHI